MLINVLTFWHRYVREKMTGYAKAKRFEKNATRIGGEKKRNKGKRGRKYKECSWSYYKQTYKEKVWMQ